MTLRPQQSVNDPYRRYSPKNILSGPMIKYAVRILILVLIILAQLLLNVIVQPILNSETMTNILILIITLTYMWIYKELAEAWPDPEEE